MARNLLAKIPETDELIICDTNPNSTKKFVEEGEGKGIHIAENPHELAQKSDTIVTVLPEPQHVKSVFEGILSSTLPAAPSGDYRLFIDCSTIDPVTSRGVASMVHNHSHSSRSPTGHADNAFVDAPMSGGVVGARAGGLTFMVGAAKELMPRLEPILLLMGKKVWHMGAQGAGLSGKLANNYALAINNIAAAEAMNLGIKWGLDPKALANLMNSATARSWPSEVNNPVPGVIETAPASRDYEGGFGVSLMKKDLKLAITAAQEAGARLELAEKARAVYDETEKAYKGKDFSVVYRSLVDKNTT